VFLLYCDSSGTPQSSDPNSRCFVTLGLCIHESTWQSLENSIRSLKQTFQMPTIPMELHAMAMLGMIDQQHRIPGFASLSREERRLAVLSCRESILNRLTDRKERKKKEVEFKKTDPYIHLTLDERRSLYEKALDLVGATAGIVLFGEIVEKSHFNGLAPDSSPVADTFEQITSRFDAFLSRKKVLRSKPEYGILVMDDEPAYASDLRTMLDRFRISGHHWGLLRRVIEIPFFVDSSIVGGVQLADLCAYATRRYVEQYSTTANRDERDFLRIFPLFLRSESKLHGLRHFCQKGSCQCKVCVERRHHIP
jgi:hypothetical protein